MDERHHHELAKWERRWIALSGLMTLSFVILIAYSLATEGAHIAQISRRGNPTTLLAQPIFAEPGVRIVGPSRLQVSVVGESFAWTPEVIRVPVGSEVEFFLTSRDVIHGWQVENTNLNVEVIPGEVSRLVASFDQVGTYRVSCNEYCGISHQNMIGRIEVVPAAQWGASTSDDAPLDGARLYARNCASCHGPEGAGVAGGFPPLAGHAADLAALLGGREYLATVMLYGLAGEIVIDGRRYDNAMPAWARLGDEAIAVILDHIVGLDGTEAEPFDPAEIAARRGLALGPSDVLALRARTVTP